MTQQRRHFRLDFALPERPRLLIKEHTFEVIDISEEGIKFKVLLSNRPQAGNTIRGRIIFRNGIQVDIEGRVIRVDEVQETAAVHLTRGVPLSIMMEQHRLMIQNYKEKEKPK